MAAERIDGRALSRAILDELTARVEVGRDRAGRAPCLAVILAGENPASQVYVRNKVRACERTGIESRRIDLPATVTRSELLDRIGALNGDSAVDGILVQLPLPGDLDPDEIATAVDPAKDADGFHPYNLGALLAGRTDVPVSCTPLGVREMLLRYGVETAGRRVVIIGRSAIVGRPLAALLLRKGEGGDATVTVCHSRTRDLAGIARGADILVAAIGRPRFVTAEMVAPGAVVIDVGINRIDDPSAPKGSRLVGDVDLEAVEPIASRITPVPGGVGPMTIAMLLRNTVDAFDRRTA